MAFRKNRLDTHVEKTENMVNYLLRKKRENIQNSLVRPLYQEALKSLFLVIALFVDTLIPLDIYKMFSFPLNIILSVVILSIFIYIEIRLYNSLWGKKGRWSITIYKKPIENADRRKKDVT